MCNASMQLMCSAFSRVWCVLCVDVHCALYMAAYAKKTI